MKRIVVIEREFGAGAGTISKMVADRLQWKLLDHELTNRIAALAKVTPDICEHREERVDPWLYRLAKVFWRGSQERAIGVPDTVILDADHLIRLSQQVIEEAANEGKCVIVGRAAAYFLRNRKDTFCVFLYAPRDFKYQRVLKEVKDKDEALRLVDSVDEERRQFIRHYYQSDWPARHLYHAMLNTTMGDKATADTILHLIEAENKREAVTT